MNAQRGTPLPIRVVRVAVGGLIVLAGLLMLVLPGPGILALILGFGLLGHELPWAKRVSERSSEHLREFGKRLQIHVGAGPTVGAEAQRRSEGDGVPK